MNQNLVGKEYPSLVYEVGREKIREYARATQARNPLYFDPQFARGSTYGNIVAPPTFAAVYCGGLFAQIFGDRELGLNFSMVVHGEQEFSFGEVVRSGDVITTSGRIENIYSKTNREGETNKFLVVATTSVNQNGQMVCDGKWTLVERQETAT